MATSISGTFSASLNLGQDNPSFEQELDANILLTELEKGLRSAKVGVQCESIVRFPRMFEKYPFPILINSAFLKLADVFRGGNNFLRWCILRVTVQSMKHLDKILNVDEFVRRIFSVIHSNDAIARAITLRTLGNIAVIIPERKTVHHTIVNSLESNDDLEVDAAVFAAKHFSAISSTFAASICNKIASMIKQVATPVDLKLSLIPILQYMHQDIATVAKARGICKELLINFPAQKFVSLTLKTMTQLASESLVDIQAQIELLINTLQQDPREGVKLVALSSLNMLAKKTPHLWTFSCMEAVLQFVLQSKEAALKSAGLDVLRSLSSSVALQLFFISDVNEKSFDLILDVCSLCYTAEDPVLSAKSVDFYTNVAISHKKSRCLVKESVDIVNAVKMSLTTQICLTCLNSEKNLPLKICLKALVNLVQEFREMAPFFVTDLVHLVSSVEETKSSILLECLLNIGSINCTTIRESLPLLLDLFQNENTKNPQIKVYLSTLMFQAADGKSIPQPIADSICNHITTVTNGWYAYKLARQAMRFGQYGVARSLLDAISDKVASEHFHFWLEGLKAICKGEHCLQQPSESITDIKRVGDCLINYQKGLAALKAAATPNSPLQFQCCYISLRIELLQIHCQLVRNCNTFHTCPPPAISAALAMSQGKDISRCGQILNQLEKSVRDYDTLSMKFSALYQTSFDADPLTLKNITLLQHCCDIMKASILSVIQSNNTFGYLIAENQDDEDQLNEALYSIQNSIQQMPKTESLSYKHMELLCSAVQSLIQAGIRYPRFFFQILQQTTLKLAVSPQQNMQMEPVSVHHSTLLTVKIEGIVQHGSRREVFRKVNKVIMTVSSSLLNKSVNLGDVKLTESNTTNNLTASAQPHNDYFSVSFLLGFPISGIHNLCVEACVSDENDTIWKTGPRMSMTIKSYDDQSVKKPKTNVRTSFGQMPGH